MEKKDIIKLISNGNLRTTIGVDEVVLQIKSNKKVIGYLLSSLSKETPAFNMRAMDAIEKASRNNGSELSPYKPDLLTIYMKMTQKEIRWHIAQILPRLALNKKELVVVIDYLLNSYLLDSSSIVKTNTIQALYDLLIKLPDINRLKSILTNQLETGTAATQARCRRLIQQLRR